VKTVFPENGSKYDYLDRIKRSQYLQMRVLLFRYLHNKVFVFHMIIANTEVNENAL